MKKILLDPGHSKLKAGAPEEYSLNLVQAQACKEYLLIYNFEVDIFDPEIDNLNEIGTKARYYDAFISFHLNACIDKTIDYCTCCLDSRLAKQSSKNLAKQIIANLVDCLGLKAYRGKDGVGIMRIPLQILYRAEMVSKAPCVLVESFFVSNEKNKKEFLQRATLSGQLVGKSIAEFFKTIIF